LQDLQPLFEKFGDLGDVYLPTERGTGRSRGFAFVRYFEKDDAMVRLVHAL
jgi:arginine/serine-rich splicing factor 2